MYTQGVYVRLCERESLKPPISPSLSVECCTTERWVDMKGGDGGVREEEEVEKGGDGWMERERGGVCLGDGRRRETSLGWGDKGALHGGNDNWVR